MKITHGLLPGQVLQRNDKNKAYTIITGVCESVGSVELRVQKAGKPLPNHNWTHVGDAMDNCFFAELKGLKVGGPYTVKLRIRKGGVTQEKLTIKDIFVGDVWILAGQSNMQGRGNLKDALPAHDKVRAFYMRDEWAVAEKEINLLAEAVDVVHNSYGDGPERPPMDELDRIRKSHLKGVGPGHAFGIDMYHRTQVPQGLIPCAHGGTSMSQWSPELKGQGGASLYGAMIRRYKLLGQPVAGVLWYQGESDTNPKDAECYTQRMIELVAATRSDMELPKLPWLIVQLGCHASLEQSDAWNSVQEQQRRLPDCIPKLDVAPAIDLGLDDPIHIGGKSQHVLGHRLARIADRLVHKNKASKPGIALKKIAVVPTPDAGLDSNNYSLEVSYANVSGGLTSIGRPEGFVLLNQEGVDLNCIYKTTLHKNKVLLHTSLEKYTLGLLNVSYGHGRKPYCNIVDGESMSLPVIKALAIDPDQAKVCNSWQTAFLEEAPTLARAGYTKAKKATGWKKAPARSGFGVLPKPTTSSKLGVYAMRTTIHAEEDLEALLIFGANAPFKAWLNGKVLFSDTKACPPLDTDQYKETLPLTQGENELMLAFAIDTKAPYIGIMARIGTAEEKPEPRLTF